MHGLRGLGKVEHAVGLLDHACVGDTFAGLRLGRELAAPNRGSSSRSSSPESADSRSNSSPPVSFSPMSRVAPRQHVAGVHADVHLHEADAGLGVTAHDGPLDGRGAAPARQQRPVHVEAAEPRRNKHVGRQDLAVGDDQREVELLLGQRAQQDSVARLGGLDDAEATLQCVRLDGRGREREAAALRLVGLRDDQRHVRDLEQGCEARHSEVRRPQECGSRSHRLPS